MLPALIAPTLRFETRGVGSSRVKLTTAVAFSARDAPTPWLSTRGGGRLSVLHIFSTQIIFPLHARNAAFAYSTRGVPFRGLVEPTTTRRFLSTRRADPASFNTRGVGSYCSRVPNSLSAVFAFSHAERRLGAWRSRPRRVALSAFGESALCLIALGRSARGVLAFPARLTPPSRSHTRSAVSGPGGVDHHALLSKHPARRPRVSQHSGGRLVAISRSQLA